MQQTNQMMLVKDHAREADKKSLSERYEKMIQGRVASRVSRKTKTSQEA